MEMRARWDLGLPAKQIVRSFAWESYSPVSANMEGQPVWGLDSPRKRWAHLGREWGSIPRPSATLLSPMDRLLAS